MLPHPIAVVAPDIRSAHNVGSFFRTADSAGLQHLYLTGYTATPDESRGVLKTALGAESAVSWSKHDDTNALLAQLRGEGYTLAVLERTPEAVGLDDVQPAHFPLALILGNEVAGVPASVLARADLVLALPQYGVKDSLNVSVAFGIAAYGLVARYRSMTSAPCPLGNVLGESPPS